MYNIWPETTSISHDYILSNTLMIYDQNAKDFVAW